MASNTAAERINSTAKTSDKEPPILFSGNLYDGGFLKMDDSIVFHFNEKIEAGSGKIVISSANDRRKISLKDSKQVTITHNEDGTSTVMINPSKGFKLDTEYSLEIRPGVVKDLSGNTFPGLMNGEKINFTTVSSNPRINYANFYSGSSFEADGDIIVNFDEPIKKGTGNITISNGEDTRTISMSDANQISFDQSSFKLNLTKDLTPFTKYTIQIDSGVVTDQQDNPFLGTGDNDALLSFYTAPPTPPQLVGFSNFIQVDDAIELFFNEVVIAGNGNMVISNGTDTRTISVTDTQQVRFSGNGVTINPNADFKAGTEYSIHIDSGAITDDKGHAAQDISSKLKFTPIASNPFLQGMYASFELQKDENISLFFNEPVKAGSGNIIISDGRNTRTISINDTKQVQFGEFGHVTIDPKKNFITGKTYSVLIDKDAITDLKGNAYAGIQDKKAFTFTAISSIPTLQNTTPIDDDMNFPIDSDIKLNFNETVVAGKGDIIITNGTDVRSISVKDTSQVTFNSGKVTINPTEALIPNTSYHVEFARGVIADTKGNAFGGITDDTTLNFTTVPSNPVLVGSNPMNDATAFDADNSIRLSFNEAVKPGSGNVIISNGSDTRTIDINDSSQIKFDYSGILINPTADLQPNTNYNMRIDDGAIKDFNGFSYAGIGDNATMNFSVVADVSPPKLISSLPLDGDTHLIGFTFRLDFDDEIVLGRGITEL